MSDPNPTSALPALFARWNIAGKADHELRALTTAIKPAAGIVVAQRAFEGQSETDRASDQAQVAAWLSRPGVQVGIIPAPRPLPGFITSADDEAAVAAWKGHVAAGTITPLPDDARLAAWRAAGDHDAPVPDPVRSRGRDPKPDDDALLDLIVDIFIALTGERSTRINEKFQRHNFDETERRGAFLLFVREIAQQLDLPAQFASDERLKASVKRAESKLRK